MQKFNVNDVVVIRQFENDPYNAKARVVAYYEDTNTYWVSNLNMPFMGNISSTFSESELLENKS